MASQESSAEAPSKGPLPQWGEGTINACSQMVFPAWNTASTTTKWWSGAWGATVDELESGYQEEGTQEEGELERPTCQEKHLQMVASGPAEPGGSVGQSQICGEPEG